MKPKTKRSFVVASIIGIVVLAVLMVSPSGNVMAREIIGASANCETATLEVSQGPEDGVITVTVIVDGVEVSQHGVVWDAVTKVTARIHTINVGPGHSVQFRSSASGPNTPNEQSDVVTTTDCSPTTTASPETTTTTAPPTTNLMVELVSDVSCVSTGQLKATNHVADADVTIKVVRVIEGTDPSVAYAVVPANGELSISLGIMNGVTMKVTIYEGDEVVFDRTFTRQTVEQCSPTTTTLPPTTTAPPTTNPTTTLPPVTTTVVARPTLPATGGNEATAVIALAFLVAGCALVAASRRPMTN